MANELSVDWRGTLGQMGQRIDAYKRNLVAAVFALAQEWATRIAEDARRAAPWTDRSGDARRTLFGRAFRLAMGAVIVVGHSVYYGIFLERKNAGKYAAILPALQRAYAAVMASLARLVA